MISVEKIVVVLAGARDREAHCGFTGLAARTNRGITISSEEMGSSSDEEIDGNLGNDILDGLAVPISTTFSHWQPWACLPCCEATQAVVPCCPGAHEIPRGPLISPRRSATSAALLSGREMQGQAWRGVGGASGGDRYWGLVRIPDSVLLAPDQPILRQ